MRTGGAGRLKRSVLLLVGALLAAAAVVAAAAAGVWIAVNWSSGSAEVTVPDLTGLAAEEAVARAESTGLHAEIAEERNDRLVPRDRILGQEPPAGARTRPGRTVRLVRSLGDFEIAIPDLVGRPAREARLSIQQLGLRVGTVSSVRWSDPEDRVLAQRPAAGEKRSKGDPVNLLVSRGRRPRLWLMPDLTGRPAEEARRLLESASLRVAATRAERQAGVSSGTVLRQTPSAGSPVTERAAVTLTLAE